MQRIKKRDKRVKRAEEQKRQLRLKLEKTASPEYLDYIFQTISEGEKQ